MSKERRVHVLATRRPPGPWFADIDIEYVDPPLLDAVQGLRTDVDVLLVSDDRVCGKTLDQFPNLALICKYGVGLDGIDLQECASRSIRIAITRGALEESVADLTFALMLSVRRRIVESDQFVRDGRWARESRSALVGSDVFGAILGIVGLGHIGRAVARRARAFQMTIVYADTKRCEERTENELGARYLPLEDLLEQSEIVTLHCPLTQETRAMLSAPRLRLLRDGACLINTARGELVDQTALVMELTSGRMSAGLDVFQSDPDVPPALFDLSNVVLTPHIGSLTHGARLAMSRVLAENIRALEEGRLPPTAITI